MTTPTPRSVEAAEKLEEVWKPSKQTPYMVSSYGRVMNGHTGRLLRPRVTHRGYERICLHSRGSKADFYVHRLVVEAFVGHITPDQQVNHKDLNKTNNRVSNLEIVTRIENLHHAWKLGRKCQGESHGRHILSEEDVHAIRSLFRRRIPTKVIAGVYGVSVFAVRDILNGRSWNALKEKKA